MSTANPQYIAAMRELRRSAATEPQKDRRDRRARTRRAAKARAIKGGW